MQSLGYLLKREHSYVAFLFFTIVIGFINGRLISKPSHKQNFLTTVGVFSVVILCGQDAWYSLATTTLGSILIKYLGGG